MSVVQLDRSMERLHRMWRRVPAEEGGRAAGASLALTVSSTCATRFVSENVGRRVVNGTERTRGSPLVSGGASP